MNNLPPIGGLGSSIHQTASKLREIVDLDKASPEEVRLWTLAGIVELNARMENVEKLVARMEELPRQNQRLILVVGSLAWIALLVGAVALARVG